MAKTLRKVTKEKQAWKRVGSQEKRKDRGWRRAPVSSASDAIHERRDREQDRPLLIPAGQGEQKGQAGENGSPCSGSGPQLSAGSSTPLWKIPSTSQTPSVPVRLLNTPLPSAALQPPTPTSISAQHTASLYPAASHTCSDGSHTVSVCLSLPSLACTSRTRRSGSGNLRHVPQHRPLLPCLPTTLSCTASDC